MIRISTLLATLLFAAPALAQPVPTIPAKVKPSMPGDLQFADIERIASWRPGGPRLVYLKDGNDQWYRADIVEPCMDLFPGKDPKFITLTDTQGKRYSALVIERRQCDVIKFEKTAKPEGDPYVAPKPKPAPKAAAAPAPAAKSAAPAAPAKK